ncbi:ROK family transcriptional regulator [Paracoccus sp. (in: a-proteobacteria)]|uniref:ROK family transcriptional regulator n=1 Tax=Paracoccus sp. TaxID=267 RepID=UPI003A85CB0B
MRVPDGAGSSPRRIRQQNVTAALQSLHAEGRLSRAELARRLRLNRSSLGQIAGALTQSGLVREVETPTPGRTDTQRAGRPGILLELVPDAACFIGIEIGVEHVSAVEIDLCARVTRNRSLPLDTTAMPVDEVVAQAVGLAFSPMEPDRIARCRGVGVSAPMHIGPDGSVSLAPLIGWRDLDLTEIVRAALPVGVPVMIENDANAFAFGDGYRHGAGGVTLFLLMESGIGGGILIDGKLFRGGHGLAGEIGHLLMRDSDHASLEQLIGREALVSGYRTATGRYDAGLAELLSDVADREPRAVTIAEDWSRHLARALVQACRVLDPERIVLGGSVAMLYPLVPARVAAHMAAIRSIDFPLPRIATDDNAGYGSAFGVACLLHQRFLSTGGPAPEGDAPAGSAATKGQPE